MHSKVTSHIASVPGFRCFGTLTARSFWLGERFETVSVTFRRRRARARVDISRLCCPAVLQLYVLCVVALYIVLIMTVEKKLITLVQQYSVLFDSGHKD